MTGPVRILLGTLLAGGQPLLEAQALPEAGRSAQAESLRRVKKAHAQSGEGMLLDWSPAPPPAWLPRFEERVDVQPRTPADAIERHLEGFDTVNGPATSAPNVSELRAAAVHKPPQGANFVPLFMGLYKLGQLLHGAPPPRYFLYVVKRGERLEPFLREGRLAPEALHARGGVTYQPVGEFAKLKEALRAQDDLRRRLVSGRLAAPPNP